MIIPLRSHMIILICLFLLTMMWFTLGFAYFYPTKKIGFWYWTNTIIAFIGAMITVIIRGDNLVRYPDEDDEDDTHSRLVVNRAIVGLGIMIIIGSIGWQIFIVKPIAHFTYILGFCNSITCFIVVILYLIYNICPAGWIIMMRFKLSKKPPNVEKLEFEEEVMDETEHDNDKDGGDLEDQMDISKSAFDTIIKDMEKKEKLHEAYEKLSDENKRTIMTDVKDVIEGKYATINHENLLKRINDTYVIQKFQQRTKKEQEEIKRLEEEMAKNKKGGYHKMSIEKKKKKPKRKKKKVISATKEEEDNNDSSSDDESMVEEFEPIRKEFSEYNDELYVLITEIKLTHPIWNSKLESKIVQISYL